MFFIRDPFAPLVDPCKPSQARATKVHLRCKWLTQKKHFTARKNDFILETLLPLRKVTFDTYPPYISIFMCLALFSVNCWPSDNGQGGCDVNIEYELEQDQLELQDVVITIPIPWVCLSVWYIFSYIEVSIYFSYCSHGSGSPVVAECDGEYTFEKRCNELLWQLPLIDANNKTGSMEFSSSGTPDDFFPVQVAFFSKKSYSGLEVWSIIHLKCSWIR